jgi:hypothetical protein
LRIVADATLVKPIYLDWVPLFALYSGFLELGPELVIVLFGVSGLLVNPRTYPDFVWVCSSSRDPYLINIFDAGMAVEGLSYLVSDLFDVGYLRLRVNYAGEVDIDFRDLLLVPWLGRTRCRRRRSAGCYSTSRYRGP